jgi:alpha/beta superfamily hydrolase
MRSNESLVLAALATVFLAACGGGTNTTPVNTSGTQGVLLYNPPPRVGSVTAADFAAQVASTPSGAQLLLVTGAPVCGIDFHYIQYYTVGGANEPTNASGALMVPTGPAGICSGARPILLYAHGTASTRGYNIANPNDPTNEGSTESGLIAAMFAAQGYIVVAPNYAGYDSSPLPYHPFVNGVALASDMINALSAARSALGHVPAAATLDSGKLFISGYSAGGYVAMATHKAMQAARMPVTAAAPMSGPYALSSFGDAIFFGNVNLGSTEFAPLIISSYQNSYPNNPLYMATTDIVETKYATGFATLLPGLSFSTLVQQGKLPLTELFNNTVPTVTATTCSSALVSGTLAAILPAVTPPTVPPAEAPLFALGFGPSNLITNSYRVNYLCDAVAHPDGVVGAQLGIGPLTGLPPASPMQPVRVDLKLNDMRSWVPMTAPVLLCGGNADPTVFYSVNTQTMQAFWTPQLAAPQLLTVLDVDSAPTGLTDPFAAAKVGFATAKAAVAAAAVAAGAKDGGATAVTLAYHGTLVPPFCSAAARGFFSQF